MRFGRFRTRCRILEIKTCQDRLARVWAPDAQERRWVMTWDRSYCCRMTVFKTQNWTTERLRNAYTCRKWDYHIRGWNLNDRWELSYVVYGYRRFGGTGCLRLQVRPGGRKNRHPYARLHPVTIPQSISTWAAIAWCLTSVSLRAMPSTRTPLSTSMAGLKSKLIPYSVLSIVYVPLSTCGVVYSFLHVLFCVWVCGECWVFSAHDAYWHVLGSVRKFKKHWVWRYLQT
jgi:hypothetical protein